MGEGSRTHGDKRCLFVVVLRHSNSISVISWRSYKGSAKCSDECIAKCSGEGSEKCSGADSGEV